MEEIVKTSLMTTRNHVSAREGSFMVLGFDFMIDDSGQVWLIEINTSPSNELSTPVTSKVIESFQRDQAKLYFDYNIFGKTRDLAADTGKFRLVYRDQVKKMSIRDKILAQSKLKDVDTPTHNAEVLKEFVI